MTFLAATATAPRIDRDEPGRTDWALAAKACLTRLEPFVSTGLGFVYLTPGLVPHAASIVTLVKQITGLPDWFGMVGSAVMACGPAGPTVIGPQATGEDGLAIMIAGLPGDSFHLVRLPDFGPPGRPLNPVTLEWMRHARPVGGMVQADSRNTLALHSALSLAAGGPDGQGPLAMTGAVPDGANSMPQICGTVSEGGATAVLLTEESAGRAGLCQGCIPFGPTRRITASTGPRIDTLDGRPARRVFHETIGDLLARNAARTQGFVYAGLYPRKPLPGGAREDPVTEPAIYTVHDIVDPDGDGNGLRVAGDVEAGAEFAFVRRDQAGAVAALDRMIDRLIRCAGRDRIRGAHLMTCATRASTVFGHPMVELRRLSERLGPIPLVGVQVQTPILANRLYSRSAVLTLWTD